MSIRWTGFRLVHVGQAQERRRGLGQFCLGMGRVGSALFGSGWARPTWLGIDWIRVGFRLDHFMVVLSQNESGCIVSGSTLDRLDQI
jgi:hypothetical protein